MQPYETYIEVAKKELYAWQIKMQLRPGVLARLAKRTQEKINSLIPGKVHAAITTAIKQMIKAVLFGAKYTASKTPQFESFLLKETAVRDKIAIYRNTAAVEGGVTGAGGIFLGLADFPLLLTIKLKLLYEIATLYGFDLNDYKERVYLLHIFELAFSSPQHRKNIYFKMVNWKAKTSEMPADINEFDWQKLQQEYRDYIDLVKMAQLVPIIGAPVGLIANYRLIKKLGNTAMNAYRMRLFSST